MTAVVEVRALSTTLGARTVLRGVDLTVRQREVVAIVGPSGGGKTTLLRGVNYLTPFTAGTVRVGEHHLEPGLDERRHADRLRAVRRRVGMVFQGFHLFPHLSAIDNVASAPRLVLGLAAEEAGRRGRALLARVGLDGHAAAYPHTLSGGQQQRVAIARALAMEPDALLLDEPTSALDPRLAGEVVGVIADLARGGQTMLMVTHDLMLVRRVADRVVVLAEGRIVEEGAPADVLDRPQRAETRALLGT